MELRTIMVGWTTTPDRETAERIAKALVEAGLAACVQISGPIQSVYRWKGKVQSDAEYRLTVKFTSDKGAKIEAVIHDRHPYETPQWLICAATGGAEKYLNWVCDDST